MKCNSVAIWQRNRQQREIKVMRSYTIFFLSPQISKVERKEEIRTQEDLFFDQNRWSVISIFIGMMELCNSLSGFPLPQWKLFISSRVSRHCRHCVFCRQGIRSTVLIPNNYLYQLPALLYKHEVCHSTFNPVFFRLYYQHQRQHLGRHPELWHLWLRDHRRRWSWTRHGQPSLWRPHQESARDPTWLRRREFEPHLRPHFCITIIFHVHTVVELVRDVLNIDRSAPHVTLAPVISLPAVALLFWMTTWARNAMELPTSPRPSFLPEEPSERSVPIYQEVVPDSMELYLSPRPRNSSTRKYRGRNFPGNFWTK